MSSFWSLWITVLTLIVIIGCFILLVLCSKNTSTTKEGEMMPHSYDGIQEMNNPLPKWWSYMFYITIVFGIVYLILYPGLGNFKGLLNWTSANKSIQTIEDSALAIDTAISENRWVQYDKEMAYADKIYGPVFQKYANMPLDELVHNKQALKIGGRLFLQNCAQCHGSDARGSKGFPNLTDNSWLYGGSLTEIKTTLLNGRNGMMLAKGGLPIADNEIKGLTEYVVKLSNRKHNAALAAQGQVSFMKGCFACHGMDGKGNKYMGAPNLTDKAWLYGGSRNIISESIINGRAGMMPAWKDILGEDKVHILTAYVYSLSAHQSK